MDDVELTLKCQEVGDVVPKDNNEFRNILSRMNQELQEFEEMFEKNMDFQPPTWSTCEVQTQTDSWSTCEVQTQTDSWSSCEVQTQTDSWSSCEVQTQTDSWSTCEVLTQTDPWSTCEVQTQTDSCSSFEVLTQTDSWSSFEVLTQTDSCSSFEVLSQTDSCSSFEVLTQTDSWSSFEVLTQTDSCSSFEVLSQTDSCSSFEVLTQTDSWSTCEAQTQTDPWSTCEVQTQTDSWSTCEVQTQTDSWSTCEVQTQTDSWSTCEAELELAREKLSKKEAEHQEACEELMQLQSLNHSLQKELEEANDNSQKHELERQEAGEKLTELQLLREKELQENSDQLRFLKQRLEEQSSAGKDLAEQINKNEIQSQKVEMLELQLLDFEDMKEKYSASVEQNQSLETKLKEHLEELKMVKQQLEEQVSVCKMLETRINERVSDKEKIESLERQLQDFEDVKEEFSWSVRQNQSLEKELKRLQTMKTVTQREEKVAVGKPSGTQNVDDKKRIEMLERQLEDFEDIKEEYTWCVAQNQSLEKELEKAREISRKYEAEQKEACEKLMELKQLQQKVFEDHLEELSAAEPQEKPSMHQTQTKTVASLATLTDLRDVKVENSASNVQTKNLVQRTRALFEKPQPSADESRPQSWMDDCKELKGNVNKLTELFEGKLEQETQKQEPELQRNRVKGKNVKALMKKFEF